MSTAWAGIELPRRRHILKAIARPLVRLCLRSTHSLQELVEVLKELFVEEGVRQLGMLSNVSRLSAATGIRRAEIKRILAQNPNTEDPVNVSILARLINQWRYDIDFCASKGIPRPLSIKGRESDFRRLCARVSATLDAGTLQFELIRRGAAKRVGNSLELLLKSAPTIEKSLEGFDLLAKDFEALMLGVEENILTPQPLTNLHLHTEFDNLVPRHLPTIRSWIIQEGKEFHRKAREFLTQFDKDLNPNLADEEGGGMLTLTAFSHTEMKHSAVSSKNS